MHSAKAHAPFRADDPAKAGSTVPSVTELLAELAAGRDGAAAELLPVIYDELRSIAAAQMSRLRPGDTVQPTALVHEAYVKLLGESPAAAFEGRRHFFGAAAQAMRELIVDHVRRKSAQKRGGGQRPETLDDVAEWRLPSSAGSAVEDVLALDGALAALERLHPRQAQVVVMRYFGGLSEPEVAEALGVTPRTVERDWRFARAWLHAALSA